MKNTNNISRKMTSTFFVISILTLMNAATLAQVAGNYKIDQAVIASGGGTSSGAGGSVYKVDGTSGQPVSGASSSTNPSYGLRSGFWTPAPFAPTSALASLGGRISTADGRGIRGIIVTLTAADGTTRTAISSTFGYYLFENIASGESYVVSVRAKKYQFAAAAQVVSLSDNLTDLNFTANPR